MGSGARCERGTGYIETGGDQHGVLAGIRAKDCQTGLGRWVEVGD